MTAATTSIGDAGFLQGRGLVLLSGVFMSVGGPLIRLIESASEWQFLAYRALALVAVLALVLATRYPGRFLATLRAAGWNGLVAGCFLACAFVGFVFSITHTTVANTLFLLSAAPFAAALLGWIALGERVSRATWVAMLGAFAGVAVMIGEGIAEGDLFGDLAALGAALGFAGFSVALRRGRGVDMVPAVLFAGVISGVTAAALCVATGEGLLVPLGDVGLSFTYGAVGIGGGLLLYTLGSRHVPAAELTLFSLTEVILGPLWVWIAFSEQPSALTILGGAILLGSIVGLALHGVRRARALPLVT
ncbi:MAG: EamA family transporter [Gammaproteobacteria bacterium]|nr:EamA family transporter [Gammaproteobacteria bacterium]NIM71902.1 EamA family transporter [Gammaproteobacteria bacterium]NIN38024.1 EamA family transporter [Gammaproteobacteria bacterium]NIO23658.1 EamA family transporter [Gammaproteobacteria bacterium]NIO64274.1 EamA family transporter [Gammaproteobacteria bacterium]